MTVTYTLRVSNARLMGFSKLLFMWRGSIYKLVYKEMVIFVVLYAALSVVYRLALAEDQKRLFEIMVRHFQSFLDVIPLTFVLGFYVSIVMKRWWDQFTCIPWPDSLLSHIGVYISGHDERGRLMRRSIMRWVNLASALIFQSISMPVKKRFPTLQHLVDAGLMTPHERKLLEELPSAHSKYWVPCMWGCNLASAARHEGRIKDDILLKSIIDELNRYKASLGMLYCYDWVSIPLVYTQVATIAVYTFCLTALMGRQYTQSTASTPPSHELDIYVPVFTLLQFFFYMGWLKVAEVMINPFGEDADDFEINLLIDRNYQVSMLAVDQMFSSVPPLEKDKYWDHLEPELPYTRSTLPQKFESYMGSTADFSLNGENTELVSPMATIPEYSAIKSTFLNVATPINSATSSPKSRRFTNSVFSSTSQMDMEALNANDSSAIYSLRSRIKDQLYSQSPLLDRIKNLAFHRSSSNFTDDQQHGSRQRGSFHARDTVQHDDRWSDKMEASINTTVNPRGCGWDKISGEAPLQHDAARYSRHVDDHRTADHWSTDPPTVRVFQPQSLSSSPLISILDSGKSLIESTGDLRGDTLASSVLVGSMCTNDAVVVVDEEMRSPKLHPPIDSLKERGHDKNMMSNDTSIVNTTHTDYVKEPQAIMNLREESQNSLYTINSYPRESPIVITDGNSVKHPSHIGSHHTRSATVNLCPSNDFHVSERVISNEAPNSPTLNELQMAAFPNGTIQQVMSVNAPKCSSISTDKTVSFTTCHAVKSEPCIPSPNDCPSEPATPTSEGFLTQGQLTEQNTLIPFTTTLINDKLFDNAAAIPDYSINPEISCLGSVGRVSRGRPETFFETAQQNQNAACVTNSLPVANGVPENFVSAAESTVETNVPTSAKETVAEAIPWLLVDGRSSEASPFSSVVTNSRAPPQFSHLPNIPSITPLYTDVDASETIPLVLAEEKASETHPVQPIQVHSGTIPIPKGNIPIDISTTSEIRGFASDNQIIVAQLSTEEVTELTPLLSSEDPLETNTQVSDESTSIPLLSSDDVYTSAVLSTASSVHSVSTDEGLSDTNTEETCLSSSELDSPYGSPLRDAAFSLSYDSTITETPLL